MPGDLDKDVLLSREAALEYVQGDEEFLQEIFQIFLEEIPGRIEMFRNALNENNMDELISLSHSLKGVSLTIGAGSCHHLSARIEMAARANDIDTVKELYPELEQILHELQERLSGMEYK
jgi:HPt (histidine-containing phosphotransfer) domain-containing protein